MTLEATTQVFGFRCLGLAVFFATCLLASSDANADNIQDRLAANIETISGTTYHETIARPDGSSFVRSTTRRFIEVHGCEFVFRATKTLYDEELYNISVSFDASRAVFPDPEAGNGSEYRFAPTIDNEPFSTAKAAFIVRFRFPYTPMSHTVFLGEAYDESVAETAFGMQPVDDERQVRDLLAATHTYQKRYCTFSG